jgi:hypothetical protein
MNEVEKYLNLQVERILRMPTFGPFDKGGQSESLVDSLRLRCRDTEVLIGPSLPVSTFIDIWSS